MKYKLYKGNPRVMKQSTGRGKAKCLFIVDGLTKALREVMRLRVRHDSDIYYIQEIADIA